MNNPELDIPAEPAAVADKAAPIGHLAIRGLAWSSGLAVGSKLISLLQQFLIARFFLSPRDFGMVAIGQVVVSLLSIGHNFAVSEVIARRHRTFHRWVQAAIWLNIALGLTEAGLVLAVIPFWDSVFLTMSRLLGGHVQQAPQVQGLLAIWALGIPFDCYATIPNARLRVDMRFRTLSLLGVIQVVGIALLSILLAFFKFGPYAMVIPISVMYIAAAIASTILSRQRIEFRPQFHRWLPLLKEGRFLLMGAFFMVFFQQGDYMITSLFFSETLLGAYYFAFRMSTQTMQLFGANVSTILVPSFARLGHDMTRQTAAYERACATLLLVGAPVCFLQALIAGPAFHLVFGDKWNDALPLFQVLSLAMAFYLIMPTAMSLLVAQGRLRLNMLTIAAQSLAFVAFVFTGAVTGSVVNVARFVALYYAIVGPLTAILPFWRGGLSPMRFLWHAYAFPVITGVLTLAAGWGLTSVLPLQSDIALIVVRSAVWLCVMALALAIVRPAPAREIYSRIRAILSSHRRKPT